jgi:hypothetical protein
MEARLNQVSASLIEVENYESQDPEIAFKGPWSVVLLAAPTNLGSRSTELWVTGKVIWMGEAIPAAKFIRGTYFYFYIDSDLWYELLRAMEAGLSPSELGSCLDDLIMDCLDGHPID